MFKLSLASNTFARAASIRTGVNNLKMRPHSVPTDQQPKFFFDLKPSFFFDAQQEGRYQEKFVSSLAFLFLLDIFKSWTYLGGLIKTQRDKLISQGLSCTCRSLVK